MFRVWRVVFATGLVALVGGLPMCFVANDYSRFHISYAELMFLDKLIWPVLLAGVVLSIIGSMGILIRLSPKTAVPLGVGSIFVSVIVPVVFEDLFYLSVFSVHSWTMIFIVPVVLGVFIGVIFTLDGSIRAVFGVRRKRVQPSVE
jgi:hypothetical protein